MLIGSHRPKCSWLRPSVLSELTLGNSLLAMGLHGDVRVQVVECAIGFLTSVPAALVHTFNLLISTTGALVLLGSRDRNKTIDLNMTVLVERWACLRCEK